VADHSDYIELLRKLRAVPGVKKVFIRSGIRFDYLLADKNGQRFLDELCRHHVSGQLRVAPEHVSNHVLDLMGKPRNEVYEEFVKRFDNTNARMGLKQYCVPYLISSHPGSTLKDAVALAEAVRDMGYMPEQVQDFYPTPSTVATVMYYTGLDPRNMKPVYVATDMHEKHMQRALIQYKMPENHALVCEALRTAGREDLIGNGHECLVKDEGPKRASSVSAAPSHRLAFFTAVKNCSVGSRFEQSPGLFSGTAHPRGEGKFSGNRPHTVGKVSRREPSKTYKKNRKK